MKNLVMMLVVGFAAFTVVASAQHEDWTLQGSAFLDGERIVLTPDEPRQGGAAWSPHLLNLNDNFSLMFAMFLGEKDIDGADGIAFVLTTMPEYQGATGGSLGVLGIEPRVSFNIYTWHGPDPDDPQPVRIELQVRAQREYPEALPVPLPNLTDGREHHLRVQWDARSRLLRVYVGNNILWPQISYFLPRTVFGDIADQVLMHYGFTGATGGLHNLQYIIPLEGP